MSVEFIISAVMLSPIVFKYGLERVKKDIPISSLHIKGPSFSGKHIAVRKKFLTAPELKEISKFIKLAENNLDITDKIFNPMEAFYKALEIRENDGSPGIFIQLGIALELLCAPKKNSKRKQLIDNFSSLLKNKYSRQDVEKIIMDSYNSLRAPAAHIGKVINEKTAEEITLIVDRTLRMLRDAYMTIFENQSLPSFYIDKITEQEKTARENIIKRSVNRSNGRRCCVEVIPKHAFSFLPKRGFICIGYDDPQKLKKFLLHEIEKNKYLMSDIKKLLAKHSGIQKQKIRKNTIRKIRENIANLFPTIETFRPKIKYDFHRESALQESWMYFKQENEINEATLRLMCSRFPSVFCENEIKDLIGANRSDLGNIVDLEST